MEDSLDMFAMAASLAAEEEEEEEEVDENGKSHRRRKKKSLEELDDWLLNDLVPNIGQLSTFPIENIGQEEYIDSEQFKDKYIYSSVPVIFSSSVKEREHRYLCSVDTLVKEFGDLDFALKDGNQFQLSSFVAYMRNRGKETDVSPLYLFEDLSFPVCEKKMKLANDIFVPKCIQDQIDLFDRIPFLQRELEEEEENVDTLPSYRTIERPRFRWILLGGRRSGSVMHIDPYGTSAWNTLHVGMKLWILIPPFVDDEIAFGGVDFKDINFDSLTEQKVPFSLVLQNAGETIFVPSGWWHAVINVSDETLASTQNFASPCNIRAIYASLLLDNNKASRNSNSQGNKTKDKKKKMEIERRIVKKSSRNLAKMFMNGLKMKFQNHLVWILENNSSTSTISSSSSSSTTKIIRVFHLTSGSLPGEEVLLKWKLFHPKWVFRIHSDKDETFSALEHEGGVHLNEHTIACTHSIEDIICCRRYVNKNIEQKNMQIKKARGYGGTTGFLVDNYCFLKTEDVIITTKATSISETNDSLFYFPKEIL